MTPPVRRRFVAVFAAVLIGPAVRAEDKPAAKPDDARRAALLKAGYVAVPLIAEESRFVVECRIGEVKGRFLIDTGMDYTALDNRFEKRAGVEDVGEPVRAGALTARPGDIQGMTIGGYDTRRDANVGKVVLTDLSGFSGGLTGALGTSTFDPFAAVIDYPARTLYLRPMLRTAWPRLAGTWTVTRWQEDEQARELDPKAPPTLRFADHRLTITDAGKAREFAVHFCPADDGQAMLMLFEPGREGEFIRHYRAGGLVKLDGGKMTACLFFDLDKIKCYPEQFAAPKGSGFALLELRHADPGTLKPPADPLRELMAKDGYTAVRLTREADGDRTLAADLGPARLRLLVDTGAMASVVDPRRVRPGVRPQGKVPAFLFGVGEMAGDVYPLRGLRLGGYDTRSAWASVTAVGLDLSTHNQQKTAAGRPPFDGLLGHPDLLNGSAVIDYGTDTLYLRPVKDTVWPTLAGKWEGAGWEQDGRRGRYAPGTAAIEFKDGRVRYTASAGTAEWAVHLRDEREHYRLGLFGPGDDVLADGFKYATGGLLKPDGDKLTLLLVVDPDKAREEPTEFRAPPGSGLLVVEYRRAK
ncbi:MAG: hypothetical protein K2X82_27235 [Gemmataceae bacterium]|nr:hypothetical protein [Gemmataceae bacterium]